MSDPATLLLLESILGELQVLRAAVEANVKPAQAPGVAAPAEGLWDAEQAAAFLGCSKSWVYDHAETGELPSLHIGGMLRFDPTEVRALAHKRKQTRGKVLPLPR